MSVMIKIKENIQPAQSGRYSCSELWLSIERKRCHGKEVMLSDSEANFLAAKIKAGDRKAQDHFVFFFEPLINGLTRKYSFFGDTVEDIKQELRIKLLKHAQDFNPQLCANVKAYIKTKLKQEILMIITRSKGLMQPWMKRWAYRAPVNEMFLEDRPHFHPANPENLGEEIAEREITLRIRGAIEQAMKEAGLNYLQRSVIAALYLNPEVENPEKATAALAKERGCTRQNLSKHHHNALEKLRRGRAAKLLREYY